jgi:hypothetical protein
MAKWYVLFFENGELKMRQQGDLAEAKYWRDAFREDDKMMAEVVKVDDETSTIMIVR